MKSKNKQMQLSVQLRYLEQLLGRQITSQEMECAIWMGTMIKQNEEFLTLIEEFCPHDNPVKIKNWYEQIEKQYQKAHLN